MLLTTVLRRTRFWAAFAASFQVISCVFSSVQCPASKCFSVSLSFYCSVGSGIELAVWCWIFASWGCARRTQPPLLCLICMSIGSFLELFQSLPIASWLFYAIWCWGCGCEKGCKKSWSSGELFCSFFMSWASAVCIWN